MTTVGYFQIAGASWVALLAMRGFSLLEIGVLESIFHVVSFCFEIPSGVAADVFGRKKTLVMGTRCGSIDPNVVPYLMKKENLTPDEMTEVMNKKSGFLGISGASSDARDLDALANSGDQRAKLALKMLTYGIIKYIGQFAAVMNGVDLIIFTGGIGEHNSRLRRRVCENFSYLGLKFDYEANVAWGEDTIISLPDSKVKVALITTDEEIVIARDTMHIVQSEEEN